MRGTFIICLGESYYIIWKIFYSSFSLITVFLIIHFFFFGILITIFLEIFSTFKIFKYLYRCGWVPLFFWNKNIFCKRILTHFRSNSWSQRLQGKKTKKKREKCQKDYLRFLYQRERWWMLGLLIYVLGFTNGIKFIKICYRYVGVYPLT